MKNTADMTNMTDVSEWGGFIIDNAREKMKSGMADGVLMLVLTGVFNVFLIPLFLISISFGPDFYMSVWPIGYILLIVWLTREGIRPILTTRRHYRSIIERSNALGKDGYRKVCYDITQKTENTGLFYCGSEWLYSPFGILCRWEDICGITSDFFYGRTRHSTQPYSKIVFRIALKNGEVVSSTVTDGKDIRTVNESFDGFADFVKSKGIAISRKFI